MPRQPGLYKPLHKLFDAPGYSSYMGTTAEPVPNARHFHLHNAMLKHGPTPTEWERRIPSSWELYYRAASVEGYYPLIADQKIVKDNSEFFIHFMRDTALVELGAGDMRKTIALLKRIEKKDWPKRIYVVDIIQDNVDASIRALQDIGYPHQIVSIKADMLKEDTWKDLSKDIEKASIKKTSVLLQGATYNNFERDEMVALLGFAHHLTNATLAYSIDNTIKREPLEKAYVTSPMMHLLLAAAEHDFDCLRKPPDLSGGGWKIGVPLHGNDRSGIEDARADVTIKPFGPFQGVFFSVYGEKITVPYTPIPKIPANIHWENDREVIGSEMGRMIKEAQVETARRLPFTSPDRDNIIHERFFQQANTEGFVSSERWLRLRDRIRLEVAEDDTIESRDFFKGVHYSIYAFRPLGRSLHVLGGLATD